MAVEDHLFRVSIKAVIRNEKGELLVVKENDRDIWELPGGGMDHGETFEDAMKRELFEEISYQGNVTMKIAGLNEAKVLSNRLQETWQMHVIYEVQTEHLDFTPGTDATALKFVARESLDSDGELYAKLVYTYCI